MEELNKTQLILLAIFLSFITSLATGIVTVTLLEQAPVGVTQTINRVVEKTVERVVPGENKVTTTIKQIIVPAEDPIANAVAKARDSFVRIELSVPNSDGTSDEPSIVNLTGVYIGKDGYVLGPGILNEYNSMSISVVGRTGDKSKVAIVGNNSNGYSILKMDPADKKISSVDFTAKSPALGMQVLGYGYKSKTESLELGRIISVDQGLSTTSPKIVSNLSVNWPVISEEGLLVGYGHKDGTMTSSAEIDAMLKLTMSLEKKALETQSNSASTTE